MPAYSSTHTMGSHYFIMAARTLRLHWRYTLLNVVGLAVGLAGGLLIFLFLRHHLSTDRYHAHVDRIFRVTTDLHLEDGLVEPYPEAPQPMAQALRRDYPQVAQAAFLVGTREITVGTSPTNGKPPVRFREHSGVGFVEPQWTDVLTYQWLHGGPTTALTQPNRAVLTESWAKRYFGDGNPLGQRLLLNNKTPVVVAGVVAEPPAPTDTYLGLMVSMGTLKQYDPALDQTSWWQLTSMNRLYVRLRDADEAPAVARTFPALSKTHFGPDASVFHFNLQPLRLVHTDVTRLNDRQPIRIELLWSLGLIGVLLVGVACINFVNLATAQALRRSREVGVRKSLGSSRRQLAGQFLLETGLIVFMAVLLAGLLTGTMLPLFRNWTGLPLPLRPDGLTLAFVGALLVGVTLLAGTYPALVLARLRPIAALRGLLLGTSANGFTLRRVLVVGQFVVGIALLIGTLVVAQQVRFLQKTDLGFQKDNVLMVGLPNKTMSTAEALRQQLLTYPAIRSVSLEHRPPANELNFGGQIKVNGGPNWEPYPVRERLADHQYVNTYGLHLLAGRNLMASDSIREYLINETLLHRLGYRNPQQAIGKRIQYSLSSVPSPIVGVVRDFHQKSMHVQIEPCLIACYPRMYAQAGIRVTGTNPAQTLAQIRTVWQKLYPNEVFEAKWLNEQVAQFYETETLVGRLINVFTAIALFICCLGLYGLVTQSVVQRTKEIGIRKVLGASVASIVGLFSKEYIRLVLIALLLAAPLAWWTMTEWLGTFAYKVDLGWWVFALAGTLAVGIALLTVSGQAIRAALVNPVKSLRSE